MSKLLSKLLSVFNTTSAAGKKTVASVMSVFHDAIADLEQVHADHTAHAEKKRQEAAEAIAAADAAEAEAGHARSVADKLMGIVSANVVAFEKKAETLVEKAVG